jgi:hypothetical protein
MRESEAATGWAIMGWSCPFTFLRTVRHSFPEGRTGLFAFGRRRPASNSVASKVTGTVHEEKAQTAREKKPDETFRVEILSRTVPAINTEDGIRAALKGKPISPPSVERYLEGKFGDDLDRVMKAMQKLAKAYKPNELAIAAYPLYEQVRPVLPAGVKGWGAAGDLDLGLIESMARANR